MRFKPGQKVVCAYPDKWMYGKGPSKDEIVTVAGYADWTSWESVILLEYQYCTNGFRRSFDEHHFEPLMDISELTEILEQQPEHA